MFVEDNQDNQSLDLKKKREGLGFSLEELFQKTRVRVIYLQAIENKNFNGLPDPVYAKNFIRLYARALGLDSRPLIEEYEEFLNTRKPAAVSDEPQNRAKKRLSGIRGKNFYLILAFILATAMVTYLWMPERYRVSSFLLKPQAVNENVSSDDAVKASGVEALLPSSDNAKNLLVVVAQEETWLRVQADDEPPFQVLLRAGERLEHTVQKVVYLDIGNAGGIKITFKGKDVGKLGNTGEVIRLQLPKHP